jgi:hypothetical protein
VLPFHKYCEAPRAAEAPAPAKCEQGEYRAHLTDEQRRGAGGGSGMQRPNATVFMKGIT